RPRDSEHYAGRHLLSAWLVAGLQRTRLAGLRSLRPRRGESRNPHRHGTRRSYQRLPSPSLLPLPRAAGGVKRSGPRRSQPLLRMLQIRSTFAVISVKRESRNFKDFWIPAFAGMTAKI